MTTKVAFLIRMFVLMCAVLLTSGAYVSSTTNGFLRETRAYNRTRTCSRNAPCLWALCLWAQYVTVDPENCMFIPSGCKCARGQRCRRTVDVLPDDGYLTVPFTCQ